MTFSQALEAIKQGKSLTRDGWNGRGAWIYLAPAHFDIKLGAPVEACIAMFTADGKHQPGWLASQADMLAEDWKIV